MFEHGVSETEKIGIYSVEIILNHKLKSTQSNEKA